METNKLVKITCKINNNIYLSIIDSLKSIGVTRLHLQPARSIVLREKNSLLGLSIGQSKIEDDQIYSFYFYIPREYEEKVVNYMVEKGKLNIPGRGTVYSERVEILYSGFDFLNAEICIEEEISHKVKLSEDLIGINCIVQRGEGEIIARMILERGFGVPTVTFGEGSGLRDKLGLIRIAISGEKEIINIVINKIDAYELFNTLIYEGKFDRPGKGFIYMFPIKKGVVNMKIYRGEIKHTASIEEIIGAIDDLKGNASWRDKGSNIKIEEGVKKGKFIENQINITFVCNEGKARDLLKVAMENGAKGATISNMSFINTAEKTPTSMPHSRESADLIVSKNHREDIIRALKDNDIFSDENFGIIEIS
ncbi:MAG TPA: hypothetical protein PLO89_10235, partial [Spirochaetota bacterium]|nr:hypothetical protein [Spirochaetota bacterium]